METLEELKKEYLIKGYKFDNFVEIKSGKEATVFLVASNNLRYALKVYKDPEQRSFSRKETYLEGKFYKKHSVRKAIEKGNRFSKKYLHTSWIKREFDILRKLNEVGALTPKVYDWTDNSILMEFFGIEKLSAPRLIEVELTNEQAQDAFDTIIDNVKIFLEVGIVHSDLSAYNILWFNNNPVIIDFPQAVDITQNPNTESLLKRDLDNVMSYFEKYIEIDRDEVYFLFGI